MEVTKITMTQFDMIVEFYKEHDYDEDSLLLGHSTDGGFLRLNSLGIDLPLLVKVLYGEYEIEDSIGTP